MVTPRVVPMGTRRYALEIAAPLAPRFKTRLERAVTQALVNPTRSLPTLRRAIIAATKELRHHDFDDERIRALFAQLIEESHAPGRSTRHPSSPAIRAGSISRRASTDGRSWPVTTRLTKGAASSASRQLRVRPKRLARSR